ncbi:3-oxoacyl-ACP reductase family protein [Flexivirga meconopsidis]|uniref:3-oxoacyl-ACP reductase family protein n=1 Tax=Flexivirga meconopsidis TaxID=2977121 RepID=UPI00224099AB|nr:3-oxoacyl-ACP reductase family protein [Flexivirga meconopsidis]
MNIAQKQADSPHIALVTGASGGLGRAMAIELDRLGCRVAVHYNSSRDGAEKTAADLHNPHCVLGGDISSWEQVQRMQQEVTEQLGVVDVLVNNSGVRKDALMAMQNPDDWAQVIQTNLVGSFHVARAFLPAMLKARWGRVVNVVSPSGIVATPGQTAYSASKAGLIGMTRTLAVECARRGVTVNALSPGFVITGMTESLSDSVKDGMRTRIPLGRYGTPEEVAEVLGMFLGADYMTGQVVSVDGGVTLG